VVSLATAAAANAHTDVAKHSLAAMDVARIESPFFRCEGETEPVQGASQFTRYKKYGPLFQLLA